MPFVYVILNGLPDFQDFLFIIAATNFDTQAILSLNAINKNERLNCWLKNFTKEYIMQNIFFFAFLNFHVPFILRHSFGFELWRAWFLSCAHASLHRKWQRWPQIMEREKYCLTFAIGCKLVHAKKMFDI